jgi:YggT family protein
MMGNEYLSNAAAFLVNTLFGLYILAVLLRLLLAWVRADFYNPISRFVVAITNPTLVPLRRMIPSVAGIDLAAVVLLIVLEIIKLVLIGLIAGTAMSLGGIVVLSIADLVGLVLNIFIVSILIQAVLSWVAPGSYHPFSGLLHQLNEPLLGPARRIIPPISGLDLSPLVVIIGIQLVKMLVVTPLNDIGWQVAAG